MQKKPKSTLPLLIGSILFCLAVGYLGGLVTRSSVDTWYPQLAKPSWSPPNAVFFPVWSLLYVAMGISLYLLLIKEKRDSLCLTLFFSQLAVNFFWSFAFFGLHSIVLALIDCILLWFLIGAFIAAAWRVSRLAAIITLPYFGWVTFALILNYTLFIMNDVGGM